MSSCVLGVRGLVSWVPVPSATVSGFSFRMLAGIAGVLWKETLSPKLFQKGGTFLFQRHPCGCVAGLAPASEGAALKEVFHEMTLSDGS